MVYTKYKVSIMDLKYYEKLMIAIVLFIGAVIFTSYTIGIFASRNNEKPASPNQIILENIRF